MNLFQSWVPVGKRRNTYSAAIIAPRYDLCVLFMVVKKNDPPSSISEEHMDIKCGGLSTCSITSEAMTASNFFISGFSLANASIVLQRYLTLPLTKTVIYKETKLILH